MSPLLVVFLTACAWSLVSAATPPPHTLEEAAHRLDMILNNTRSRENYIRCFMDRGICNKDALSIKRILTDALSTNCTTCTQNQRLGAERFIQYMKTRQPEAWTKLSDKYGAAKEDDDDESDDSDDDDDKHEKKGSETDSKSQGAAGVTGEPMNGNGTEHSSTISIIF